MTPAAPSETRPDRLSQFLLGAVDLMIAALVFVLPFIMGGREAWGHWFLISAALVLGIAWAVYATVCGSRYVISWLEVFLLAGLAIVFMAPSSKAAANIVAAAIWSSAIVPFSGRSRLRVPGVARAA